MGEVALGKLINAQQERDAAHVAVIPMQAGEMLRPGQRVGIVAPGVCGPGAAAVGIVDPFLDDVVPKGRSFWLVLFPGSVTGMRHHWCHPAFKQEQPTQRNRERENSEEWLRDAAIGLGLDYEDLISDDSELLNGGSIRVAEDIRDQWNSIQDDFWRHYEIVTGSRVPTEKRGWFACSC